MGPRLQVELYAGMQRVNAVQQKSEALFELIAINTFRPRAVYPLGVIEVCVAGKHAAFEITGTQLKRGDLFIERGIVQTVVVVVNRVEFGRG